MQRVAQVLVFASQKGGSGKTTLSGHIAVEAQRAGAGPVALIDTDPQGSLAKWWNAREDDMPMFIETSVGRLGDDIAQLRDAGLPLIVIDTPPAVTSAISEVIAHADMVVVPTRPSPHDLRAVGATVDLVEAAGKPLVFVVNCATARARITSETAVTLSQHGTVAPVTVHNRVDFAASMIDGRVVGEIAPECRSAQEVSTLWRYLDSRLRRLSPDPQLRQTGASRFGVELLTPGAPQAIEAEPRQMAAAAPRRPAPAVDDTIKAARRATAAAAEAPTKAAIWDGIDRRRRDQGPPPGMPDRRGMPIFGRRTVK